MAFSKIARPKAGDAKLGLSRRMCQCDCSLERKKALRIARLSVQPLRSGKAAFSDM